MRIVIVTGMSGAGKSTVLKSLEDLGFFCVDNLPVSLIGKFTEAEKELDTILKGEEARPADEVNEDRVNHEMDEGVG